MANLPRNSRPRMNPASMAMPRWPIHPSVDVAWCVLEAANDLGDVTTVEACRASSMRT